MVLSMDRWVGKVAVVTGAAGGIGSVVCKQLVELGIKVAAVDVRHDELLSLSKDLQGKILPVEADLTKEADIVAAFKYIKEKLNSVDILINNAGVIQETNLIGGDAEKWRKIFDVNTIAFCICVREAIEIMKKDNLCGHIICVNSVCGHRVPNLTGLNVYPGSKHAVTALLKSWRNEVDQLGLNVKITVRPSADMQFLVKRRFGGKSRFGGYATQPKQPRESGEVRVYKFVATTKSGRRSRRHNVLPVNTTGGAGARTHTVA